MSNEKQICNSYHKGAVRPRLNIRRVTGALFIMLVISSCASINPFTPIENVQLVSEISPGTYSAAQPVVDINVAFQEFDFFLGFEEGLDTMFNIAEGFQTGDIEISNKFGRDIEFDPSDVRILVVIEGTMDHDHAVYKELGVTSGDSYRYISYLEGSDNIEVFLEGYKTFNSREVVPYLASDFLSAGTIQGRESASGKIAFVPVLQYIFFEAVDIYNQEAENSMHQADASPYLTSNLVRGENLTTQLVSDYELLAEYGEYWKSTQFVSQSFSRAPSVDIFESNMYGISESSVTNAYGVLLATVGNEVFEIPLDLDFYIADYQMDSYTATSLPVVR